MKIRATELKNIKLLGGIGSLFIVSGVFLFGIVVGIVLQMVGITLLSIAIKKISDAYPEKKIFTNFLIGFLVRSIGLIFALFVFIIFIIPLAIHPNSTNAEFLSVIGIFVSLVLSYGGYVVGGAYYQRCFLSIHEITNNDLFKWAGILVFWGSVASIILVGLIVVWIGWILLTVAFFTVQETEGQSPSTNKSNTV